MIAHTRNDYLLIAAAELGRGGKAVDVFSLTVRAWNLSGRTQLGLRGYEADYPDHKEASVRLQYLLGRDLVHSRSGTHYRSPVMLERCGPNKVRLTDLGWAYVNKLRDGGRDLVPCVKCMDAGYIG